MKTIKEAKKALENGLNRIEVDKKINQRLANDVSVKNLFVYHYQDLHMKNGEVINRNTFTLKCKMVKVLNGFVIISMRHYIASDSLRYQVVEDVTAIDNKILFKMIECSLEYWKNYVAVKGLKGILLAVKDDYHSVLSELGYEERNFTTVLNNLKDEGRSVVPNYAYCATDAKNVLDSWISIHNEKNIIQNEFVTCEFVINEERESHFNIEHLDFYYENEKFHIEITDDGVCFVSNIDNHIDEYDYLNKNILRLHLSEIKERNHVANLLEKPVFHTMKFFKKIYWGIKEEKAKDLLTITDTIVGDGKTEEEMVKCLSIYNSNLEDLSKKRYYNLINMKVMSDQDHYKLYRFDTDKYYWFILYKEKGGKLEIIPSNIKQVPNTIENNIIEIIRNYLNK